MFGRLGVLSIFHFEYFQFTIDLSGCNPVSQGISAYQVIMLYTMN